MYVDKGEGGVSKRKEKRRSERKKRKRKWGIQRGGKRSHSGMRSK